MSAQFTIIRMMNAILWLAVAISVFLLTAPYLRDWLPIVVGCSGTFIALGASVGALLGKTRTGASIALGLAVLFFGSLFLTGYLVID